MNRIRQGMIMAEHPYLTPEDLGMERRASDAGRPTLDDARARAEIDAIRSALRRCQNNVPRRPGNWASHVPPCIACWSATRYPATSRARPPWNVRRHPQSRPLWINRLT